ncbi:MAG: hypothetical protein LJE83_14775 [Gammaproteobacteria bacterium]|jgi:predicted porin|nr:hypothetical protein [Gammaproteobacteria bacterium]
MKSFKAATLTLIATLVLAGLAIAEENVFKGAKLGLAFDRGLGVIGTVNNFNIFIGNDGAAVDYIFKKDTLKVELEGTVNWYVGGGAYADWDSDRGIRLPVGAEWYFAKNLDAFAQVMPRLRLNNDARFGIDLALGLRYKF